MNQPLTIAVLAGTTRADRQSIKAARYVADFGRQLDNVEVIFVDPVDFTFDGDGNDPAEKDPRYTDITARADAFFIVSPEYNHSFPGSLKRMLDSEYANYNHKPVAFAGASSGNWGGVRAIEALILTTRKPGMVPLGWDVHFPYVQDIFDEQGAIKPAYEQQYTDQLTKIYDELTWFATILKANRS